MSDVAPPYMGGGESYVIQLGTHLVSLGHEIRWLTSRLPNTKEYENYHGIQIHRLPILFSKKFLFPGRQTFPIVAALQKLDFVKDVDIVQANTMLAGLAGTRIAKKVNKPSVLFCHEFFGDLWQTIGQNILQKKVYPIIEKRIAKSKYDWYLCPSEYSKSTLIKAGAPKDKITVIPHGINHDLYNQGADETYFRKKFNLEKFKLFGYLGRLRIKTTAHSKNLMALLEATKIVTQQLPNARLVLAGSGYEEMEPFVKSMGLTKSVIYVGNFPYEDNPKFFKMCDVVVCPAVADGFCFMLAEASACGVPVVASNTGSHPERITDKTTGLLTDPSPDAIANSIIEILSDENKSKKFGLEGSCHSKTLSWEKSATSHLEIYSKLLE